ncbi:glycosyltransferase family 2 protein [Silvibacterium acidisoli]|uniref:glycosyltransferase family 2 protein n=1 Tax=Acidobacteriaceae bacterium ZG23-2 TaxID=2883246 RepID=UPI00406C452B
MSQPLRISVAMCTFNGARYLEEQLTSIEEQCLPVSEVVICDDASTDDTPVILNDFAHRMKIRTLIIRNQERLGVARNFEGAIRRCTGDIIALADQDDRWYPGKTRTIERIMREDPGIGGVFSDASIIDSASTETGESLWNRYRFSNEEQSRMLSSSGISVLLRRPVVTGAAFAFRSSLVPLLLPIPSPWMHDAWLAWKIALHSRLVPLPQQLMAYRVHTSQQIGVPPRTMDRLRSWWHHRSLHAEATRQRVLAEYRNLAEECGQLVDDASRAAFSTYPDLPRLLMEKSGFCREVIESLDRPRWQRVSFALERWKQYQQYTYLGWHALLRDVLL